MTVISKTVSPYLAVLESDSFKLAECECTKHISRITAHILANGHSTLEACVFTMVVVYTESFFHLAVMVQIPLSPCQHSDLPSPLIPLVHSFHTSFSSFRFITLVASTCGSKGLCRTEHYTG